MRHKLENVRIAFCQNLFNPALIDAAGKPLHKPTYSSTFLIPKTSPLVAEVRKTIEAVAAEKWKTTSATVLRALAAEGKVCLKDGDLKTQYDGFEGCMFINASTDKAPLVVDKDKSQLSERSGKPYAGCYVIALVDIWAQDNKYGKRINAQLKGVQFYADGDAFSGSAPASEDDFSDVSDTGAAQTEAQTQPAAGGLW